MIMSNQKLRNKLGKLDIFQRDVLTIFKLLWDKNGYTSEQIKAFSHLCLTKDEIQSLISDMEEFRGI